MNLCVIEDEKGKFVGFANAGRAAELIKLLRMEGRKLRVMRHEGKPVLISSSHNGFPKRHRRLRYLRNLRGLENDVCGDR